MTLLRPYSPGAALDRPPSRVVTIVVFLAAAVLLWVIVQVSSGINVPFDETTAPSRVSTDPAQLPYYAARSLLRMFAALGVSLVFTFIYATAAARLRRAQKVMLPILDILQSVPILGFLSVTITGFIALFPGSQLGLECASIFAIFTSQAWNMTFAFYHSLSSQPRELDEAARNLRLSRWQRFWRVDVPSGMIPLVWNGMMSFGGGWFFLVASEALSVNNHHYALPGIGSYVASATADGDLGKVFIAIGVMVIMVVGVNVLFWRPLTAWAERFRVEESEAAEASRSLVLNLLRRSHVPVMTGRLFGWLVAPLDRLMAVFGLAEYPLRASPARRRAGDVVFATVVLVAVGYGVFQLVTYINATAGFGEVVHALGLGLVTFGRVIVLVIAGNIGLGADRGVDWVEPQGVSAGATRRAGAGQLPSELLVPDRDRRLGVNGHQPELGRHRVDEPGRAVVHPVQRHRRSQFGSQRSSRSGGESAAAERAVVAPADPARDPPELCHRWDHRRGRGLERIDRRRGRQLRINDAGGDRAGRLHRPVNQCRRLTAHPHRRPGDELLRRQPQPRVLAAPLRARAAPLLPLTRS